MTTEQQEKFCLEYKNIVYQKSLITKNLAFSKQLHAWDKNGSHQKAILKNIEQRKELNAQLRKKLKGMNYEEWKMFYRKLMVLKQKIKTVDSKKEKYQTKISELTFKL